MDYDPYPNYHSAQTQGYIPPVRAKVFTPASPAPKKTRIAYFLSVSIGLTIMISTAIIVNLLVPSSSATLPPATPVLPAVITPNAQVGETINVFNTWQMTIASVKTSNGTILDKPQMVGDTFLLLDVRLLNISSTPQDVSSLLSFILRDTTGQAYNEALVTFAPTPPNATNMSHGKKVRGTIAYEIPSGVHTFTLDFLPSLSAAMKVTWDLHV